MYNYLINIPFIYFVTECMTTSAPRDKGRYKIITFCSALKSIQTKWLEISYVITETKVKISFSFQIKVGQFGIISLWQLRVGIGYLIPYLGSEILHWRDFCGSQIKRWHQYSYGKRGKGGGWDFGV